MKPQDQGRKTKADHQVVKNPEDKNYVKEEADFKNPSKKRENSEQPFNKTSR